MNGEDELPEGWVFARLSEVSENHDGRRIPVKSADRVKRRGAYPYYGASGAIDTIDDFLFDGTFLLVGEDGANLLSRSTPIAFLASGQFWVNNHAHVLQPLGAMPVGYLLHYLNSFDLQHVVTGTAQPKLTQAALNDIVVPTAPLPEQHRIVEKVEALLAQVNKAKGRLDRVKVILKRFRQGVLAAACSGRLTEEWREKNAVPGEDRTAETDLPSGWNRRSVGDLVGVATGATPLRKNAAYYTGGTVPWIKSGSVNTDPILTPDEFITEKAVRETNAKVFPAGTLVMAMYGEGATRGKIAELGVPAATNQALAALLFTAESAPLRSFMKLALQGQYNSMRDDAAGGVQPNLSLGAVRSLVVDLPPPKEQAEIVRIVQKMFSLADTIETRLTAAASRAEKLPQAILSKAFRGELVPTEAELARAEGRSFESAEELLERVKAGVSAVVATGPNRSRRRRAR